MIPAEPHPAAGGSEATREERPGLLEDAGIGKPFRLSGLLGEPAGFGRAHARRGEGLSLPEDGVGDEEERGASAAGPRGSTSEA